MTTFLWVMAVVFALDVVGRMHRLKNGDHTRTPGSDMLDAICNGAFLVWVVYLLATGGN